MRVAWADWRGPVPHKTPGGLKHPAYGVIFHIMGASMSAADNWFHSPNSQVSAHFGIGNDGKLVQWVDTDDRAWHAGGANTNYIGVETEGSSGPLSDAGIVTFGRLYRELQAAEGFPFALADTPGDKGLGWHGMGGSAWGGHPYCPGPERKAQRARVLQLAQGQASQPQPQPEEDEVKLYVIYSKNTESWLSDLVTFRKYIPDGTSHDVLTKVLSELKVSQKFLDALPQQ